MPTEENKPLEEGLQEQEEQERREKEQKEKEALLDQLRQRAVHQGLSTQIKDIPPQQDERVREAGKQEQEEHPTEHPQEPPPQPKGVQSEGS